MDHGREEKGDLSLAKELEEQNFRGETILNKTIDWNDYCGDAIQKKEAGTLIDFCQEKDDVTKFFDEESTQLPLVLIHALQQIIDEEIKQYLVTKVAWLFETDPKRARYFHEIKDAHGNDNPYKPFFDYLEAHSSDTYGVGRSAYCLAILFQGQSRTQQKGLVRFFNWLMEQIVSKKTTAHSRRNAVMALKHLLKDGEIRSHFVENVRVKNGSGMDVLVKLLRDHSQNSDVQLLYLVVYCLWLISFQKPCHGVIQQKGIIRHLTEICKTVNREKVVRVCLSTFVNLIDEGKFNEDMIGFGLPKVLGSLTTRKWKDTDLIADLEKLDQKLDDKIMELSSYEMYRAEVLSGALRDGPVHTEQFWRENYNKFDENNFDLIKPLIALLNSEDDNIVSVACYDLGEFARFHPDGKRRIINQKLQTSHGTTTTAKILMMGKMSHSNPDVQKQALLAVQKLMVKNWESLAGSGGVASLTGK